MKRSFIITVFTLVSIVSFGQNINVPKMDGVVYFGTTNKLGLEFNNTTKTNLLWGLGCSIGLNTGGVGTNYTKTMGPNTFAYEIYETKTTDHISVYGNIGYSFGKLSVGGRVGMGTAMTYFNAYDRQQILSNTGYYYTSTNGDSVFLLGGFMTYNTKGKISPNIGFDNYNGATLGLSFRF